MSNESELKPPEFVTDEQLHAAGFTPRCREWPRDEVALRLLCAFNGVDPKLAPPGWWFHPGNESIEAWKRVADAAREIFSAQPAVHELQSKCLGCDKLISTEYWETHEGVCPVCETALNQGKRVKNSGGDSVG